MKIAFNKKKKVVLIFFKGLSVNAIRPKSAPLTKLPLRSLQ